ncbi:hypothetical protein KDL01_24270 [Actinospica durhamensis]|uniref:Uncharacterized protein n=1 Tax=Actinospica durhamensis TaxID=1508375 RepID=A0A941IPD4_9ACTN|nr:hypothetical protein [Actinospica durhamensis]MBR7836415.1 hypothetical protein [Actinospica durhamensis]
MTKTTSLLQTAQPYLRDQYATVRDGFGPALSHTREVAVPMAVDASHRAMDMSAKMRNEILPVAGKRAMMAAAVLRGAELERQRERSKWRMIAAASAAGAALGAGAYVWQRKRAQECWCEECAEDSTMAHEDSPPAPHVEAH